MKKNLMALLVGLVLFVDQSYADPSFEVEGYMRGADHVCLSSNYTYYYSWSKADHSGVTGEVVTFTVKDRAGNSIDVSDVIQTVTDGVLKLEIDKNHFDIFIIMKVVYNGETKNFAKTV